MRCAVRTHCNLRRGNELLRYPLVYLVYRFCSALTRLSCFATSALHEPNDAIFRPKFVWKRPFVFTKPTFALSGLCATVKTGRCAGQLGYLDLELSLAGRGPCRSSNAARFLPSQHASACGEGCPATVWQNTSLVSILCAFTQLST